MSGGMFCPLVSEAKPGAMKAPRQDKKSVMSMHTMVSQPEKLSPSRQITSLSPELTLPVCHLSISEVLLGGAKVKAKNVCAAVCAPPL